MLKRKKLKATPSKTREAKLYNVKVENIKEKGESLKDGELKVRMYVYMYMYIKWSSGKSSKISEC